MALSGDKLAQVPLFQGLPEPDLARLSKLFQRQSFDPDAVVFAQGDHATHLYVLLEGHVSIRFKPHDGEQLVVAELDEGEVFGWSAALGRNSYTSCAVATQPSQALCIRGQALHEICIEHPQTGVLILERLAGVIAERLRNTHKQVVDLLWQGVKQNVDGR
jgi:CRP-like cAMP-binding protein